MGRRLCLAALVLVLATGCAATPLPAARPSSARAQATAVPGPPTIPPAPSTFQAEFDLPTTPVRDTVYDLGRCSSDVVVTLSGGFALVVYAFNDRSQPLANVTVSAQGVDSVTTDAKGRAQLALPVTTKRVALKSGAKTLESPVSGQPGECKVIAAFFGS